MVTTRYKAAVESGEAPPQARKRYTEIGLEEFEEEMSEHDEKYGETSPKRGKKGKKGGGGAAAGEKKRGRPSKKMGGRELQHEEHSPPESDEEAKKMRLAAEEPQQAPQQPQQQEPAQQEEGEEMLLPPEPPQFAEAAAPQEEQQQEQAEQEQQTVEPETQGMEEGLAKYVFQGEEEQPTQAEEGGATAPPSAAAVMETQEAEAPAAAEAHPVEEEKQQQQEQEQPKTEEPPATTTTTAAAAPTEVEGTVEQGRLLFFYRPKVGLEEASSLSEVQRFYMIFAPQATGRKPRLAVLGKKRLPRVSGHERFFGFIEAVGDSVESLTAELGPKSYETKTRGTRHVAAARAVGEATYAIVNLGGSGAGAGRTNLVLKLIVPQQPGEVQEDFAIPQEGSYAFSIKNPKNEPSFTQQGGAEGEAAGGSGGTGTIGLEQKAEYTPEKKKEFGNYAWIGCTDPSLLEYERCEFLLVGVGTAAGELMGGAGSGNECAESDEECLLQEMKKEIFGDENEDVAVEMQPAETGEWK
ncbi:hypothetical protein Ndes2526B_g08669 [Nannochloris sp. 'desiccata']|nr:hypothetical protein KSW81_001744 [Chlorella desiccata (nom. nud.)]KAH7616176.1 hypothetical protein NADE_001006 [Chlorella desiccata (nom. nud.)]KAH7616579.1 hypothetical protein NADE_001391 [Chlorella desiccata (nom. nud.)]